MLISISNRSSLIQNSDIETMVAAIQIQINLHIAPAWNRKPCTIKFYSDESKIPGYAWKIYMIDNDAQVPGALGYHQEEANGRIDGYIMCEPVLSNGGDVLKFDPANPGKYTVSGTLSHEVAETFVDRYTNNWFDNGNVSWCAEVSDPVEQISYGIDVNGVMVSVSDFVFPAFFNPYAKLPENAPLNYLNTLTAPFTMLRGSYSIQRTGGPGTEQQVFGEHMPEWRREMKRKSFSRMMRRFQK